ncbi:MAG: tRNA (cytidine(56)-2'-O)-methyltransferase [Thermosphaera sp.]
MSEKKVYVLRYGHRPQRDKRVTTHALLVARAFGANGFILGDVVDEKIREALEKTLSIWGGRLHFEMGVNSFKYALDWKKHGIVVHLTMYGLPVDEVLDEIKRAAGDLLIVIGASKVPRFFYEVADYNVAIGNQPHSEIAALAIFLDRYYQGRELSFEHEGGRLRIIPQRKGKKVVPK